MLRILNCSIAARIRAMLTNGIGISGQQSSHNPRAGRPSLIFNEPEYGGDRSYGIGWDAHPAAKIVVFGLPKSGNVWLMALLCEYFSVPAINIFNQPSESGVGMTHYPFTPEIKMRDDIIHGACLIRDIRDVVASFYHYSQTDRFKSARRDYKYSDIDSFYYDWFLPIVVPQYRVHTFAEEYARLSVPVIRYERMCDYPVKELCRLLERWGFDADEERATQIIEQNALERLRNEGKQVDVYVEPSHFRKGGYGNYVHELPHRIVADINDRFGDLLRRWGYL